MISLVVVSSLLSVVTYAALFAVWKQHIAINSALAEPRLENTELLRLLANTHAAAKHMLDTCPLADLSDHCVDSRSRLSLAIAAVDEFARSTESPHSGR